MSDWSTISDSWRRVPAIALAAAIALLAAGFAVVLYNEHLYRTQKSAELSVQTEIVAASLTAALAFHDDAVAREYVGALRANPEIEAAGVFDDQGVRVAGYVRSAREALPRAAEVKPAYFDGPHLIVTEPVVQGGSRLGLIYVRATAEPPARRALRYGVIMLLVVMAALLVAVLGAAHAALRRANLELEDRARELGDQAGELAAANQALKLEMHEREKAEEALRQSQKLEAIGQLTGGVAHDFNNLLMVVSSGLELIDRTNDPVRQKRLKDGMRQAVERGSSLTRQLLTFSRRTALKPEVVDVRRQIEGMRVLLERSLRENIEVRLELPDQLWPVEVDASQLELALINIAVNARDAMPDGGALTIEAQNCWDVEEGELQGDFVCIAVTDTGTGMTPEMLARVFEPFFTTKGVGKGTGLGLSQVYGFTQASGGDVRIESRPGVGTTVRLRLPRTDRLIPDQSRKPASKDVMLKRTEGRVLLVEDDSNVAAGVTDMLAELGYGVTRVATGPEAMRALERGAFDLVFSDMVMPGGMTGLDLAREIAKAWPRTPVVLTTGYSEAASAATAEGVRLLVKPYRIEALAAELEAARTARANRSV